MQLAEWRDEIKSEFSKLVNQDSQTFLKPYIDDMEWLSLWHCHEIKWLWSCPEMVGPKIVIYQIQLVKISPFFLAFPGYMPA